MNIDNVSLPTVKIGLLNQKFSEKVSKGVFGVHIFCGDVFIRNEISFFFYFSVRVDGI